MPKAKRLTHEESKAQTRSRLISVGREHFLRYGFSKATAEAIAEDAGYTRGALRSNFGDKEGLFLAVVTESHRVEHTMFTETVNQLLGENLLQTLRKGFADLMTDPDYLLMLEFDLESLRNDTLRAGYMAFHEQVMRDSCNILKSMQEKANIVLAVPPREFVLSLMSFSRGLAVKRILLQPSLTSEEIRRMMYSLFDCMTLRSGTEKKMKGVSRKKA